jgi:hypothetical protein
LLVIWSVSIWLLLVAVAHHTMLLVAGALEAT